MKFFLCSIGFWGSTPSHLGGAYSVPPYTKLTTQATSCCTIFTHYYSLVASLYWLQSLLLYQLAATDQPFCWGATDQADHSILLGDAAAVPLPPLSTTTTAIKGCQEKAHYFSVLLLCLEIKLLSRPAMSYCWEMGLLSRPTIQRGWL